MSKERFGEIAKNIKQQAELTDNGLIHQVILKQEDYISLHEQAEKVPGLERDRKYWYEIYQQQKELSRGQVNKLQERVQELEKENKELLEAGKFFESGYRQYEKENQRYKEALEFYANPQIWKEGKLITDNRYEMPLAYNDNGEKAQQALEGES